METISSFFKKDLIFVSDARSQNEVFEEIGSTLCSKGLVNEQFTDALIDRENKHPTGLDLAPVAEGLANTAIPHTETEYCKTKAVVFVKLKNEVIFHNMIAPDQTLKVKYLFFIINDEKGNQTKVLSNLMDFMTNEESMRHLEQLDASEEIYDFLVNN